MNLASRLFLFSAAQTNDPAVKAWFLNQPETLAELALHWFTFMRGCGDDVCELLHDGHPTACVGQAAFAEVNVFKAHANVGFFRGAELDDPAGLLQGAGKLMRHVKLTPGGSIDDFALRDLIKAAYEDMKARLIRSNIHQH